MSSPSSNARTNPSRTSKRIAVALLALVGALIAARLTAYQLEMTGPPWEPFFGTGTERVLGSSFSRSLPFPDAGLGLLAYVGEAVIVSIGAATRWHRAWTVYVYAAIAMGMALGSVALVVMQVAVIHAFCTLCLASAVLSFALVAPALKELVAARHAHERGHETG